jgi:hypothetical protein
MLVVSVIITSIITSPSGRGVGRIDIKINERMKE